MRLNEQIRAVQLVESVLVFDELGLPSRIVNDLALGKVRAGERYLACREERLRVWVRPEYLLSISADHVHHNYRSQHNYDSDNDRKLDKREALFVL